MQNFKKVLLMTCLATFSNVVNAQYQESMSLYLLDDDLYTSDTPSPGVSREKTVYNNQTDIGGINYSIFKAELSAEPVPFVSTSYSTYLQTGERGYEYNYGTNYLHLVSSIDYDFNVSGTPGSIIPVSMKAIARLDSSNNIQTRVFDGVSYANGRDGTYSQVGLNVSLNDANVNYQSTYNFYPGNYNFSFTGSCQVGRCDKQVNNTNYEFYPFDTSIKINGQDWLNDSSLNYVSSTVEDVLTNSGINRTFDEVLIEATFKVMLNEDGNSQGRVSMFSTSGALYTDAQTVGNIFDGPQSIFASSSSYLDPFFSIDPAYLALNPSASLSFTPGVGNLNPLAAVPEPETYAMMLLGLGLIGFTARRKNIKAQPYKICKLQGVYHANF